MKNQILIFGFLVLVCFLVAGCTKTPSACTKTGTSFTMTLDEAKAIAKNSDCNQGNLKENAFCNEGTGTWWIDLDITKEGCNPACVINVETKQAEINWRCTGLVSP